MRALLVFLLAGCAAAQILVPSDKYPPDNLGVQAAINDAPEGGVVKLAGPVTFANGVVISRSLTFDCGGWANKVTWTGIGDVVTFRPLAKGIEGGGLANCMIFGSGAQNAVVVDSTNYPVSALTIEKNYLKAGGRGIYVTNPTPLQDGFFASWITRNTIYGGIKMENAGDSLTIDGNRITGENIGIDVDFVDWGGSNQPAMNVIRENNITSEAGCIVLRRAHQVKIINGFCEGKIGLQFYKGAQIVIEGRPDFLNEAIEISGNKIAPIANNPAQDAIRIECAKGTAIHDNFIANSHTGNGSRLYRITPCAVGTRIRENFEFPYKVMRAASVIDDQGVDTQYFRPANVRVVRDLPFTVTSGKIMPLWWTRNDFDTDGLHATGGTRLTAQVNGIYQVSGAVEFDKWMAGIRQVWIVKNGQTPPGYAHANTPGLASLETRLSVSDKIQMKAGDYVELFVYQDSSLPLNVLGNNRTSFSMSLLPN